MKDLNFLKLHNKCQYTKKSFVYEFLLVLDKKLMIH